MRFYLIFLFGVFVGVPLGWLLLSLMIVARSDGGNNDA